MMEERAHAMRAKRKSPVQPSQQNRRKKKLKKRRGIQCTVQSYGKGIAAAIKRHNKGKPETDKIPHWHPNQMRHLRALELKRQFGLDVVPCCARTPATMHHRTLHWRRHRDSSGSNGARGINPLLWIAGRLAMGLSSKIMSMKHSPAEN